MGKQAWARLWAIVQNKGDARFMEERFNHLFCQHHRHACELVYGRNGQPLAAVYFAPGGKNAEEVTRFLRAVRDRMAWDAK